jgi:hypothetical protein
MIRLGTHHRRECVAAEIVMLSAPAKTKTDAKKISSILFASVFAYLRLRGP